MPQCACSNMQYACRARAAASGRACRVHMRARHAHVQCACACALFLQHNKAEAAGLVDGADCADARRDRQLPVCDRVWGGWWGGWGWAWAGAPREVEVGGGRWEVMVAGGGVGVGVGGDGGRGGWRSGAAAAVAAAWGCARSGGCPGPTLGPRTVKPARQWRLVGCESLCMKQPKRKPIEVKKHSSCSEGMWITASRTGAQYLNGVAQGCRRRSSKVCARDVRIQEERRA